MQQIFKGMDNGASTIDANFNELANPSRNVTVGDLNISGQFKVTGKQDFKYYNKIESNRLQAEYYRFGSIVFVTFHGFVQGFTANNAMGTIPVGYRPTGDAIACVQEQYDQITTLFLNPNGGIWFPPNVNGGNHSVNASVTYTTADDFPS